MANLQATFDNMIGKAKIATRLQFWRFCWQICFV